MSNLHVRGASSWHIRSILAREGVGSQGRCTVRAVSGGVDVDVSEEEVAKARVALDLHGFAYEETGDG